MQKISNTSLFTSLFKLLVFVLVAKLSSLVLLWFLPHDGVSYQEGENYQPPYVRYTFEGMLSYVKEDKQQSAQSGSQAGISITNMILKGLYGKGERGVVVVALKASPKKSDVIAVGETFSGFTLKSIEQESAVFEKGGQSYILEMDYGGKQKTRAYSTSKASDAVDISKPVGVTKNDINFYAKNPNEIWKQIAIQERKEKGKIVGFEVKRIAPNSPFEKLGLQKGDLITKANNVELRSYKDAIAIYEKIDTLKSVQIVFMRNNQEMEIVYEVH
jgi:type II secretion system protein C